jgi:hypothetical protein
MIPYSEVVRVLDSQTLINAESYQCRYETAQGMPLDPGFYIVVWPTLLKMPTYNGEAKFFGPFGTRTEASAVLQRSLETYCARLNEAAHSTDERSSTEHLAGP